MSKKVASWLRISLEVDPELAEAVSEVFARTIPGGVVIESTAVEASFEDEGRPVGPLRVLGYLPIDAHLAERRAEIEQNLRYLGLIQPVPEPSYQPIQEENWMESWKVHFRPLNIGDRILIVPAWQEVEADGRIPIRIEPGMAFGTGVHPSTQLSLQLLERYLEPGHTVIDVGCGSGILAIAAAKLGAAHAVAVDIDATALDNARHNAKINNVEMEMGQGSVPELLAGKFSHRAAHVVVANILAPVLSRLLDQGLAQLLKPQGALILSGVLAEQESDLRPALKRAQMDIGDEIRMGDWLALAAFAD